ncbi:uncharacterized protein SRS1_11902 [Sporisorium reilianum f. sp. reilianum]|uniref:DUF4187 domain-containing protein n=1 Tax=Sporisorium reilianum f. sp. reilianum TaxID=72559 RepID=A0A2N8U6H5_9BASI|nr:uncharacterized protein SRS1_11902 [Sporisorium reilianum f. sp. reilianum]
MPQAGSSSRQTRFDALRLLSEIQTDPAGAPSHHAGSTAPTDDSDDDGDFMSDKFLVTTEPKQPLTYTDKRRKLEAHHSRKAVCKSAREREEEARQEGLDRDLLAEAEIVAGGGVLPPEGRGGVRRWDLMNVEEGAGKGWEGQEDGTKKAMRMMLAMGYRRGEALGKRMQGGAAGDDGEQDAEEEEEEEEEEKEGKTAGAVIASSPDDTDTASLDTDEEQEAQKEREDSQAREEDDFLSSGVSVAPFTARLDPTQPLRPDQRRLGPNRHAGIGMLPPTPSDISAAIRARAAIPHTTTSTDDFRTRIAHEHAQRHTAALLSRARTTLTHLDQSALHLAYSPLWLSSDTYHLLAGHTSLPAAQTIDDKMHADAAFKEAVELLQLAFAAEDDTQREEARVFVELDADAQLELVLERLRGAHRYCLFCGCQYDSADELQSLCPGTSEDDHD